MDEDCGLRGGAFRGIQMLVICRSFGAQQPYESEKRAVMEDRIPDPCVVEPQVGAGRDQVEAGGIVAAYTGRAGIPAAWLAAREPLPKWVAASREG